MRIQKITTELKSFQVERCFAALFTDRASYDGMEKAQVWADYDKLMAGSATVRVSTLNSGRVFELVSTAGMRFTLTIDFGPDGSENLALEVIDFLVSVTGRTPGGTLTNGESLLAEHIGLMKAMHDLNNVQLAVHRAEWAVAQLDENRHKELLEALGIGEES